MASLRGRPGGHKRESEGGYAPVTSAEEKNKALVRRLFKVLEDLQSGKADLNTLDELLAPDFVSHYKRLPGQQPDREGFKRVLTELRATRSNVKYLIEDQIAGEDKVVTRFIVQTTDDQGELLGVAPTGREVSGKAILIYRIERGKIAEEWGLGTMGPKLMRQRLAQELEQERIERERIEQELQVARRIQQASLPKEVPELQGWKISPFYQPAREVGGDFYDFHLLSEGRVGIVVGDATGKGVPAALVMSTTCGMLQAVSQAFDSSSPGEVLERVNETLVARIPSNMFVTCFYAILDPESGTLSYANAGHDLPYLRRPGGECEELRARGMPLGIMPGMGYEQKEILLEEGEAALFYSDGLVEAHDPEGEMFGFPRLQALVAEHGEENSLEERLLEELYSFVGEGWEQEDDITLLTLRRSAP
jgi:serine phosphatase RsbU (regulator of sigma subunit)/ketosteroid isomerase-like protein